MAKIYSAQTVFGNFFSILFFLYFSLNVTSKVWKIGNCKGSSAFVPYQQTCTPLRMWQFPESFSWEPFQAVRVHWLVWHSIIRRARLNEISGLLHFSPFCRFYSAPSTTQCSEWTTAEQINFKCWHLIETRISRFPGGSHECKAKPRPQVVSTSPMYKAEQYEMRPFCKEGPQQPKQVQLDEAASKYHIKYIY